MSGGRKGGRRGGGGRTVGRGVLEKDLIESSSDSDASDGCRPRKVSADVFRDNSLSEG